jgi:hypothetical protein
VPHAQAPPVIMASSGRTDSPASRAFADKLAKYAYDPTSGVSPRRSSRTAGPSMAAASPVRTPGRMVPQSGANTTPDQRISVKREPKAFDEEDYEEEVDDSPSRKRVKTSKTTPTKLIKGKKPRPFAAPEVYAHLRPVNDHIKPDLNSALIPFRDLAKAELS